MSKSKNGIWFGHDSDGYELLSVPYKPENVSVHQLTAIAHGADPHKVFSDGEYVTHHKKNIPWLNTPDNLQVVSKGEHNRIHKPREIIEKEDCAYIRQSDKTILDLANEFGLSKGAICKHIYGECTHFESSSREKLKGPRDGPWKDKDVFYEVYVVEDNNLAEVGDILGCSQSAASIWKRKHGIEK